MKSLPTKPVQEPQTVTREGQRIAPRIAGVEVRDATTQIGELGETCEIYDPGWGLHPEPLVYVYLGTVRPRRVKGWALHRETDDRIFVAFGALRIVLFDPRDGSPTRGSVSEICLSDRHRGLVVIPRGVWHALENVGETEAVFVNMPTRPYRHEHPDKYNLPLENGLIPYRFEPAPAS
jgi:dTDP-4-dehydrorhamnose 3,5-epimerase